MIKVNHYDLSDINVCRFLSVQLTVPIVCRDGVNRDRRDSGSVMVEGIEGCGTEICRLDLSFVRREVFALEDFLWLDNECPLGIWHLLRVCDCWNVSIEKTISLSMILTQEMITSQMVTR